MNGSEEWLNENIGSLFFFATFEDLKNMSNYFSDVSDALNNISNVGLNKQETSGKYLQHFVDW